MQQGGQPLTGGRRLHGISPVRTPGLPCLTIIVVVFNARETFAETFDTVRAQTYPNTELLVIDGGSTDGTVDLLRKHDQEIDYWVSEKDRGIYDAFNKGSRLMSGDWAMFLGGGDRLCSSDVVEKFAAVALTAPPRTEILYGRVCLTNPSGRVVETLNGPWEQMRGRWCGGRPLLPHHQGVFHSRDLISGPSPFDISYRVAADSKLMLKSIQRADPLYADVDATIAPLEGVSTAPKYVLMTAREILRANRDAGVRNFREELRFYLKALVKRGVYKIGGDGFSKPIIDFYRRITGRHAKWQE